MICHLSWCKVVISNDIAFTFLVNSICIAVVVVHLIDKHAISPPPSSPNPNITQMCNPNLNPNPNPNPSPSLGQAFRRRSRSKRPLEGCTGVVWGLGLGLGLLGVNDDIRGSFTRGTVRVTYRHIGVVDEAACAESCLDKVIV